MEKKYWLKLGFALEFCARERPLGGTPPVSSFGGLRASRGVTGTDTPWRLSKLRGLVLTSLIPDFNMRKHESSGVGSTPPSKMANRAGSLAEDGGEPPPWAVAMESRMTDKIINMFKAEVIKTRAIAEEAKESVDQVKVKMSEMQKQFAELKSQVDESRNIDASPSKVQEMVQEMINKEGGNNTNALKPKWGWWSGTAANRASSGGARSRNYENDSTLMGRTAVVSGFAEFTYSDKIKEVIKKNIR